MALYRDTVARWSLAAIRVQFPPRVFRRLESVSLEHDGHVAVVELRRIPYPSTRGGARTMLACPRCGELVFVVGCSAELGWGCSKCLRWRGRNRRRLSEEPFGVEPVNRLEP